MRSLPANGAVAVMSVGLILTGCGSESGPAASDAPVAAATASETASASPKPAHSSPAALPIGSLDELFQAVDERLDCPEVLDGFSWDDYLFVVDGGELRGRQCGETLVMAWSGDQSLIRGARDLMSSAGGPVPTVGTPEWFVADITGVGEGGTGVPEHQAGSRDLNGLAAELGADFTAG
jgi:hypothetical protein